MSNSCLPLNELIKPDRNDSCVKSGSEGERDIGRATRRLGLSYRLCLIQRSSGRQRNIKLSGSYPCQDVSVDVSLSIHVHKASYFWWKSKKKKEKKRNYIYN